MNANYLRLAVAFCMFAPPAISTAEEPASHDNSSIVTAPAPADRKSDDRWQVFTKKKNGQCTIYEGVVKSISTQHITIIVDRLRLKTYQDSIYGFIPLSNESYGEWKLVNQEEVTIPVENVGWIRTPKAKPSEVAK